ncbi:NADP-dependent oxidoreductase domain-containing protein 1-like [Mercenaria mercenaria]|uniref:NADP-dependent oxidoreductase domain-containing protein 1-like n=1 Tax=Mercenaria mercenaria TaxID=6596 RepID=UPI00234E72A3|nr:NADP-dependent oxidoreductase domain-containing protein 1-like [Mercenaria mercenaria]XP_053388522.1 NADP-dependent oxidoreductase domain-containing protein 1-like [Mercenaria mercenaria]
MALATRLQQPSEDKSPTDITLNLSSLQFESALDDDEKELQYLRKRAHALTVTSCAQATYFVSVLHEARQLKNCLKSPQKRSTRILQDQSSRDPLKIGILGCGRLGSQLAHSFITYGNINPKDIKISTRRPETLEYLSTKGVDCFHDNIKLVTTSHIVFLCVLPSQVPTIADEVKADIPQTLFLYSFASSISARKLRQLFGTTSIIRPDYTWDQTNDNEGWDFSINVNSALENKTIVSTTCPLRRQKSVITTNPKLAELMIFVLVNMCTHLKLNKYDVIEMLHIVMFNNTPECRLELNDFIRKSADKDELFPPFDLLKVLESNTAVLKRLNQYEGLYNAFVNKYNHVFEDYLKQKLYNEMYGT